MLSMSSWSMGLDWSWPYFLVSPQWGSMLLLLPLGPQLTFVAAKYQFFWPVPDYTPWWRRLGVNNLPRVITWNRTAGSHIGDLLDWESTSTLPHDTQLYDWYIIHICETNCESLSFFLSLDLNRWVQLRVSCGGCG